MSLRRCPNSSRSPARASPRRNGPSTTSGAPWRRPPRQGDAFKGILMPIAISREEVKRLLREEQAQLVEALPSDEYEAEHLPGAINIPLKTLGRATTASLDRHRPVIVYCYDYQ